MLNFVKKIITAAKPKMCEEPKAQSVSPCMDSERVQYMTSESDSSFNRTCFNELFRITRDVEFLMLAEKTCSQSGIELNKL